MITGKGEPDGRPAQPINLDDIDSIYLAEGEHMVSGYEWDSVKSNLKTLISRMTDPHPLSRYSARDSINFIESRFMEKDDDGRVIRGQWRVSTKETQRYAKWERYAITLGELNQKYLERFRKVRRSIRDTINDMEEASNRLAEYKEETGKQIKLLNELIGNIDLEKEKDTKRYSRRNLGMSLRELEIHLERRQKEHEDEMTMYRGRLDKDHEKYGRFENQYRETRSLLRKSLLNYLDGQAGKMQKDDKTVGVT